MRPGMKAAMTGGALAVTMREAFVATSYTNRGGCVRRRALERCGHEHRTHEAASRCARSRQLREPRPRSWRVAHVVWWAS